MAGMCPKQSFILGVQLHFLQCSKGAIKLINFSKELNISLARPSFEKFGLGKTKDPN